MLSALVVAASTAILPVTSDVPAEALTAVASGLQAAGHSPAQLPAAEGPCDDPCAAAAARNAGAGRVVVARARSAEGATLLELRLVDAADGRLLSVARSSGLGLKALLDDVPRAVARLLAAPGAPSAPAKAPAASKALESSKDPAASKPPAAAPAAARPEEEEEREIRLVEERRKRIEAERRKRDELSYGTNLARMVEEVASDLEKARGLQRKRKLQYQLLENEKFREALRARATLSRDEIAEISTRWVAFGMARTMADPGKIAAAVVDEGVLGFYDPKTRTLYVRTDATGPASLVEEGYLRSLLAHEIEHALQDQNFGLDLGKGDRDARLARRALFEGDAMLAETAYEALHSRRAARWVVGKRTAALRSVDWIQFAQQNGYSDAISSAPRIVQEEAALPYIWGFGLVSDVFRRGGFAAVDKMFSHPPRSTRDLFDTASFLAGQGSVEVPQPAGLPGRIGARGRMGVLGTKVVLANCVDPNVALDVARGLTGDAFTAVRLPDNGVAAAWATAWRDADAAKMFQNAIDMQRPCWSDQSLAAGTGELYVSDDVWVASEANRVVVVRGLPEAQAKAIAARAIRFDASLPKPHPPFEIDQGELLADNRDEYLLGKYTSTRLGLRAEVPEEFRLVRVAAADFAVMSVKTRAMAAISFVPETPTSQSISDLVTAYVGDVADWRGGLVPQLQKRGTLFGRETEEHSWTSADSRFKVRFSVMPVCHGRAYFAVVRAGMAGKPVDESLESWMKKVEPPAGDPPACSDLQ